MAAILSRPQSVNSFLPCEEIWWHTFESTLAQVNIAIQQHPFVLVWPPNDWCLYCITNGPPLRCAVLHTLSSDKGWYVQMWYIKMQLLGIIMMASWHGNDFRIYGSLCEKSTGVFPWQMVSNADLWYFYVSLNKLLNKQPPESRYVSLNVSYCRGTMLC